MKSYRCAKRVYLKKNSTNGFSENSLLVNDGKRIRFNYTKLSLSVINYGYFIHFVILFCRKRINTTTKNKNNEIIILQSFDTRIWQVL